MTTVSPQYGSGSGDSPTLKVEEDRSNKALAPAAAPQRMDTNLKVFNIIFGLCQGMGILCVILVLTWTLNYRGGFGGRSHPQLEFNWHPLFMTVGLIYLFGSSILIYRALRSMNKMKLKIIHASIHTAVVICILIAQIAVFDSHNYANPPIPNLYSLHSWIGLTAILIFVIQWASGIYAFLYPLLPLDKRTAIMPFHVFFGLGAFILSIAAALSGLLEKALFSVNDYSSLPAEGLLMNMIGLFIIIFGFLVLYLVTEPKYKRLADEDTLLTRLSD